MTIFKSEPWAHQREWLGRTASTRGWGVFWEQGTGKSKLTIDTIAALWRAGEIDAVVVVASNGVHLNWATDELPAHLPDDVAERSRVMVWSSQTARRAETPGLLSGLVKHEGLSWFMISYDAFMTELGKKACWKVLQGRRVFMVLDEAHNIKSMGAKRTKSLLASAKWARYRRVLTGTPVTQGPFDVYAPIKFVDPTFWERHGFGGYVAYKTHFGIWEKSYNSQQGREYDSLLGYRHLGELNGMLAEISCRVLKEDVLDLPPKVYSKRRFELSPAQRRAYRDLEETYFHELENGEIVNADLAIVRLLRFQQITSGYLPNGDEDDLVPLGNSNPRLSVMEDIRDGTEGKTIVWARFTHEIDLLMDLLGPSAVRYDGRCNDEQKLRSKQAFQQGDAQWFVGNQMAGSEGLTLHSAMQAVYYSNTFRLRDRLQSEDRCHRGGMSDRPHQMYTDILADNTVDEGIVDSLRAKREIAGVINGDQLREWI